VDYKFRYEDVAEQTKLCIVVPNGNTPGRRCVSGDKVLRWLLLIHNMK
jgi:hypothetical protein